MQRMSLPVVGVLLAIAITTTMDAVGLSDFSALPLAPLLALFWYLERLPRASVGFALGRPRHYVLALLYPLAVMGLVACIAGVAGAVDLSHADWAKAGRNIAIITVSTLLVAIVTEEGFFRGWLWASLARRGRSPRSTLVWTSFAFAAWHISAVTLDTGFDLPAARVPVYLANALLIGLVWGMLRMLSGSVVVASLSHGAWNALAYVLFGFGTNTGALGIENTALFGPEVGVVGLLLNASFALVLWRLALPTPTPAQVVH